MIPRFLRNIIKIEFKLNYWKVCDPPNTHCIQLETETILKCFGLTLLRILIVNITVGPSFTAFNDIVIDICIKFNFKVTSNVITLDDFKQLIVIEWFSEPSILAFILSKIMMYSMGYVVSI